MPDLNFGLIDLVNSRLDKHKDQLGPFHRPLSILVGSAIFLLLLAVLIGLPMTLFDDFSYIVLGQFTLIAVYFMLLLTIKLNVFDRFVFCLALFLVVTAGPVLVSLESFLALLQQHNENLYDMIPALGKVEVFAYSLLRGLGNVMWALPMLFMFFTFFPLYEKRGAGRVNAQAANTFWVALALQLVAAILVPWLAGGSKAFAPIPADLGGLGDQIRMYQVGYAVFLAGYLLVGFVTIFMARLFFGGNDRRWLAIVVTGLVLGQSLYVVSSYNGREVTLRYPGSRTTASYVEAYRSVENAEDIVFTNPRLHNINQAKYGDFVTYASCEGDSGEFSFKVIGKTEFDTKYKKINLINLRSTSHQKFFCPINAQ